VSFLLEGIPKKIYPYVNLVNYVTAICDLERIIIIARQQLKPVYHRDGAAYVMTRDCLLIQKTTIGENASAVKINAIIILLTIILS